MYDSYHERARFLTIYISEAHPNDEWQMDSNRKDNMVFNQPRTFAERCTAARLLPDRLHYRIPVAVDPIEAPAEKAFAAWPERIYIMDVGGRVVYKAEPGPFGFKPEDADKKLKELLATRKS